MAEGLVVLNSASMDQTIVKENVRPLQIIKGSRHVKKNRCEGLKKLIQSLELNSTNAMVHVMQC